jgi:DNA-binding response OmpR family regulator
MNKDNILIIDDDQAQHEILGEHLELAGYNPLHATNSEDGFALLKKDSIALILLDINMPKMDGFQTIEILRNDPETRNIPVLFLTSLDRQYLKIKGLELGADDYVSKPYNGAELVARIKAIIRRKGTTQTQEFALSGNIKEIGMGDLLQNISQTQKTGKIEFPDMNGEVIISGEEILWAHQGNSSQMEALLRLMLLEHGRFAVSYDNFPVQKEKKAITVMKALLHSVNEIDQIRMAVEETTGQPDPFLEINGSTDNAAINKLKAKFPCRLINFATTMEKPLKENIYNLLKAIHTKQLTVLPAEYSV